MDLCDFLHAHGDPKNEERGMPFLIGNDQTSPDMSQNNPWIIVSTALLKKVFSERLTNQI